MASMSRFLTQKLRLKVNEAKSAVARPEERKFLGFSISNDGSERRIASKALDKFKTQIRDLTRRTRGISLPQLIEDLMPYLIGWRDRMARLLRLLPDPTRAHEPGSVDPGQAGKSQALHLVRAMSSFTVTPAAESGDKLTRFGPFSAQCRAAT